MHNLLIVLATCRSFDLISNQDGAKREGELASILGSSRVDYAAITGEAAKLVPDARLDMIDIERIGGTVWFELELEGKSKRTELRWPIAAVTSSPVDPPAPATVIPSSDEAAEEDSGRDHVFRMRPPEKPEGLLPTSIFR